MNDDAQLDLAERVVAEKLVSLACTTPVDPFDPEDCASVAQAAVAALRAAGLLAEHEVRA